MVIEINKDIDRYQETVAMGLTAKQLVYSVASVAVGGGLVLLLYPYIGLTGAAYVAIPCVAPIALGGFYSYNGMSFYEYMWRKMYFFMNNKTLTYVSTEGEPAIMVYRQETDTDKKRKKKNAVQDGNNEGNLTGDFVSAKKKAVKFFLLILFLISGLAAGLVALKIQGIEGREIYEHICRWLQAVKESF